MIFLVSKPCTGLQSLFNEFVDIGKNYCLEATCKFPLYSNQNPFLGDSQFIASNLYWKTGKAFYFTKSRTEIRYRMTSTTPNDSTLSVYAINILL